MNHKKFYTTINCLDPFKKDGGVGHALANTRTAIDNGADGVFLNSRNVYTNGICYLYEHVRKQHPDLWIGINFPDTYGNWINLFTAVRRCSGLSGLWIDTMPNSRLELPSTIQVFGKVAFGQKETPLADSALALACEKAVRLTHVALTDGVTLDTRSLEAMKGYLANRIPLAVAGGITASNVASVLPYTDIVFVGKSITERNKEQGMQECFVPERVREMADKIHK